MILHLLWLVGGFVLLIYGADYLVKGSVSVAKRLKMSELAIGLTIVSVGTSTPELIVNILSGISGASDLAIGNVIGSNNFNTFMILGISSVIYPITVKSSTVWREIPIALGVGVLLLVLCNDAILSDSPNLIDLTDTLILLIGMAGFMYYVFGTLKDTHEDVDTDEVPDKIYSGLMSAAMIIGGIAALVYGGQIVVDHASEMARDSGLSEKLIGLTIVAAGTSLPELVTSVMAARKKKSDIAIGNVVGSNIFNILLILPAGALFNPIIFNTVLNLDILLYLISNVILFLFMFTWGKKKLDRNEGIVLIIIYIIYTGWLISVG